MASADCRFGARHVLPALSALVLLACASLLGSDRRELDVESSYPLTGYAGCHASTTCVDCLEVHRAECEIRAACDDAADLGACSRCVCEGCLEPLVDCRLDSGCSAIWECLRQSRCELSEDAGRSCARVCAAVIEAHGGTSGSAFRDASSVRTCAAIESCLSCLPPEPAVSPAGCSPENDCASCADCFQQCLCSGDTFSVCQELCGEDAPSDVCSVKDECAGCTSCFDVCACQGGSFSDCSASCQLVTPVCSPEGGCSGCADGAEGCECQSETVGSCEGGMQ